MIPIRAENVRLRVAGVVLAVGLACAVPARADVLDPWDFASLGVLDTSPGTYVLSTAGTPSLTAPDGSVLSGVVSGGGIAVFTFSAVNVVAGTTILVDPGPFVPGTTRPAALLSQSILSLGGAIVVSPTSVSGIGAGKPGEVKVLYSGGIGPGATFSGYGGAGGGGFGTAGGRGGTVDMVLGPPALGGFGGQSYGNLYMKLEMGSPGGPGFGPNGLGGGAIELGASDVLHFSGSVSANGSDAIGFGAGGGSGGGILMHAPIMDVSSHDLTVAGGAGGFDALVINLLFAPGGSGGAGQIVLVTLPEPGPLELAAVAVPAGLGLRMARKRLQTA